MKELSGKTKAYLIIVYILALGILTWTLFGMRWSGQWILLGLCIAGALASVFKVEGATNRSHYTISFLIYGFAFALLGSSASLVVITVSSLVEWLWRRPPWFIQAFNLGCYILVMYAAGLVYAALNPAGGVNSAIAVVAIFSSMTTFTLLNHVMVGIIVWLARGENFEKSGVFDFLPLVMDLTLLSMGASMVIVWNHNPAALLLFTLPLYLIYSTLRVPALERQTETDSKTGLFNHAYFMQQVESELRRASRFDRPLAIIMADLDLLRNINNTYGHLAGDEVLVKIATVFRESVREYDVVARFGGEEFAILMPETEVQQAFERAEKLRQAVEKTQFVISTSVTPIRVTVSVGIAGRERFDQAAQEIIHNADTALYHSKLRGRNQTYVCANQAYASFLPNQGTRGAGAARAIAAVSKAESDGSEAEDYQAADAVLVRPEEPEAQDPIESPSEAPAEREAAEDGEAKDDDRRPGWPVNLFIGCVAIGALISFAAVLKLSPIHLDTYSAIDWLALATFAALVVLTEWLSVELYVKHTTVSTSAVPMLAGSLLFGPLGALILSATFAITALIKYRSPASRLIFNFGNQLIAAMAYTGLIAMTGRSLVAFSLISQVTICLTASFIVYVTTTALVAGGISIDLRQPFVQVWREQYGWMATSYVGMGFITYALIFGYKYDHLFGIVLMIVPLVLLRASQKQYVDRTRTMVNELHDKQRSLERTTEEIRALNEGLLDTLAEVIDLGDPYVLGHSMRVAEFATEIAGRLGLHQKQIELIRSASMLHDIGKLGISSQLLGKPAKLTAEEYEHVKKHVSLGADLLDKSPSLRPLVPIIGSHHEHYDGRGYPNRLHGREIPLEARIIAASDAIETMASDRPYRKAMPIEKIVDELHRCSGTQFDPQVVNAAVAMLSETLADAELGANPELRNLEPARLLKA